MLSVFVALSLTAATACTPDEPNTPKPEPVKPKAERFEVFQMPTPTEGDIPYRIPAIAVTKDGTLVAIADYRHSGTDIGVTDKGRIDLHYRLSYDNGNTWTEVMPLIEGKGKEATDFMSVGYGDPCIVADRESDRVLMLSCAGNVSFQNGTRQNHQCIARFYSEDGGKTWSAPEDIAESIYAQFDASSYGPVRSMFVASGRIMQSRMTKIGSYYRLYCAVLVRDRSAKHMNYVLYSDDFGHSWKVLGNINTPAVYNTADEPKVEEMPDGTLLLSSRYNNGRYYNLFVYTDEAAGTGVWDEAVFSGAANNGVAAKENSTNGEVMLLPVTRVADGEPMHILLQSLPLGLTVRVWVYIIRSSSRRRTTSHHTILQRTGMASSRSPRSTRHTQPWHGRRITASPSSMRRRPMARATSLMVATPLSTSVSRLRSSPTANTPTARSNFPLPII